MFVKPLCVQSEAHGLEINLSVLPDYRLGGARALSAWSAWDACKTPSKHIFISSVRGLLRSFASTMSELYRHERFKPVRLEVWKTSRTTRTLPERNWQDTIRGSGLSWKP